MSGGTFVIPNIWFSLWTMLPLSFRADLTMIRLMLHDPVVFPSPEEFNPDRFIGNQAAVDAVAVAFGFGRRFCPGINLAESSMFVAIATILVTCNITNVMDENGNHLHLDAVYRTSTISHPHHSHVQSGLATKIPLSYSKMATSSFIRHCFLFLPMYNGALHYEVYMTMQQNAKLIFCLVHDRKVHPTGLLCHVRN